MAPPVEPSRPAFSEQVSGPLFVVRLVIGSGKASPEPIPFQAVRQTLYSQDLKLVARAAPGAEAILRMSPQVCL